MSTNHHTPIPSTGVAANAANINSPLGDLDSAITSISSGVVGLDFLRVSGSDPQTISVGAVTILKSYVVVDTEAAAATDDLDTITGGSEGMILLIRSANAARVVTLTHGVGNIINNGDRDVELDDPEFIAPYLYDGSNWVSLSTVGTGTPTVKYVDFSTIAGTPTHVTGRVWYDVGNKTLTVDMDGGVTRLQVGQENIFVAHNSTVSTIVDGTPVYLIGAVGFRPKIQLAKADVEASSQVVGLLTDDILAAGDGWVANIGRVNDIDTTGTPVSEVWANGDVLYLSATTAGTLTNVAPLAPNFVVKIGIVVRAHAVNGVVELDIQWYGNTTKLADINGSIPTNGDVLIWDNASGYYDPGNYQHGHAAGLSDDDHPQYALLAGRAGDKLIFADSATTAPTNWTERSAAPSSPASGDMYLDDGTNTADGGPGLKRYTGAAWEDLGTGTMVLIETITTSTSPTDITFTGIPQTFSSLKILGSLRSESTNASLRMTMGDGSIDSGANYNGQNTVASATATTESESLAANFITIKSAAASSSAGTGVFGCFDINILKYANASYATSLIYTGGGASGTSTGTLFTSSGFGYYSVAAGVDQIKILIGGGDAIADDSEIQLFGIV